MPTTISAEDFLGRSVTDPQRGRSGMRSGPTLERLFAAGLDQRKDVADLIERVRSLGCQIHFEDNSHQRNYAPRIYLTGTYVAVLKATAMVVSRHKPDEMYVAEPRGGVCTAEFWWD